MTWTVDLTEGLPLLTSLQYLCFGPFVAGLDLLLTHLHLIPNLRRLRCSADDVSSELSSQLLKRMPLLHLELVKIEQDMSEWVQLASQHPGRVSILKSMDE